MCNSIIPISIASDFTTRCGRNFKKEFLVNRIGDRDYRTVRKREHRDAWVLATESRIKNEIKVLGLVLEIVRWELSRRQRQPEVIRRTRNCSRPSGMHDFRVPLTNQECIGQAIPDFSHSSSAVVVEDSQVFFRGDRRRVDNKSGVEPFKFPDTTQDSDIIGGPCRQFPNLVWISARPLVFTPPI